MVAVLKEQNVNNEIHQSQDMEPLSNLYKSKILEELDKTSSTDTKFLRVIYSMAKSYNQRIAKTKEKQKL